MSKSVVVYGSRVLSKMLYYDSLKHPNFRIVAFTQDDEYLNQNGNYLGLPQVAFNLVAELYPPNQYDMIVLTASYNNMRDRNHMHVKAKEKGYFYVIITAHQALYRQIS